VNCPYSSLSSLLFSICHSTQVFFLDIFSFYLPIAIAIARAQIQLCQHNHGSTPPALRHCKGQRPLPHPLCSPSPVAVRPHRLETLPRHARNLPGSYVRTLDFDSLSTKQEKCYFPRILNLGEAHDNGLYLQNLLQHCIMTQQCLKARHVSQIPLTNSNGSYP